MGYNVVSAPPSGRLVRLPQPQGAAAMRVQMRVDRNKYIMTLKRDLTIEFWRYEGQYGRMGRAAGLRGFIDSVGKAISPYITEITLKLR